MMQHKGGATFHIRLEHLNVRVASKTNRSELVSLILTPAWNKTFVWPRASHWNSKWGANIMELSSYHWP